MDQHETKEYFLSTYDAYADAILRFCIMKVSDREIAEDLTQEVFTRFWQTLRDGQEMRNGRAFLYTIARNLVIDWYRRKKELSLDSLQEQGTDFANNDLKQITNNAEAREVLEVIEDLDDPSREALLMRYVEGLSPSDIADITGESPNVISVRINRAIKKVQQRIHA